MPGTTPTLQRSGHIALAGLPNSGKSSLLNALVGTHLAIVSPKPQATRLPVVGLRTEGETQFVFHDLPGLLDPTYLLQSRMRALVEAALERVHVILHLHPAPDAPAPRFESLLRAENSLEVPLLTIYTKADLMLGEKGRGKGEGGTSNNQEGGERLGPFPLPSSPFPLFVSATTGQGIPELLAAIRPLLPERPFEFDPDDVGTQPVRFFAGEYLREAAFALLTDEVPYSIAAEVEEFRENEQPIYIRVTLYVERDSQKGIVIGRGGKVLKAIGEHARHRLEALLGQAVFLETWVKVLPNWRRNALDLGRLGFPKA